MHDCMRLSGIFFMLAIGGGSAEIKHLNGGMIQQQQETPAFKTIEQPTTTRDNQMARNFQDEIGHIASLPESVVGTLLHDL